MHVVIVRTGTIIVEDSHGNEIQVLPNIPYGAVISKFDGEMVRGGSASTETLRVALQRYRSFFERLLSL